MLSRILISNKIEFFFITKSVFVAPEVRRSCLRNNCSVYTPLS